MTTIITAADKSKIVNEATEAFLKNYAVLHPKPEKQTAKTESADNWMLLGIFIVLIGATITSASHTIPTVVKGASIVAYFVGVSTFVMIELALIIYAFFNTRVSGSAAVDKTKRLSKSGLRFVLAIAIGTNLHYVMTQNGFAVLTGDASIAWRLFDFGVTVVIALSAPILAFISGEIMAITLAYRNSAQSRLDAEYNAQVEKWMASAKEAWSRDKRNWGGNVRVDSVPVGALEVSTLYNGRPSNSGRGYTRVSTAYNKVKAYIEANPDSINLPVRELASVIGVGKTTVANVITDVKMGSDHA